MHKSPASISRFKRALRRLKRHAQGYSHHQTLRRLSSIGFLPDVIYDVGAHTGTWTQLARSVFPKSEYVLFEANPHLESALKATGELYFITALSDVDGASRTFHLPPNPDVSTTAGSFYRERPPTEQGQRQKDLRDLEIKTSRLDTLQSTTRIPQPALIKLDVEGAELEVLRGAGHLLNDCSAIIAELSFIRNDGAPLAHETMQGIYDLGFVLVDICKIRRTALGNVCQMDALFVSKPLNREFRCRGG